MIPLSPEARLKSLRHAGKKRIGGLPDIIESLEPEDSDVSGTRSANLPISDNEGGLIPESYDVRANQVEPEGDVYAKLGKSLVNQIEEEPIAEEVPEESLWSKIGSALKSYVSPQERERVSQENQQMLGIGSPAESESILGKIGSSLKEYIEPFQSEENAAIAKEENQQMVENAQLLSQGIDPETHRQQQQLALDQKIEMDDAEIEKALQNPMESVVYGATDKVRNSPELVSAVTQITGQDFSPQIQEMTSKYERILKDMDQVLQAQENGYVEAQDSLNTDLKQYDDQMNRIKQRIETNSATDDDKYFVGLALLMPLLIGMFAGKEAGLGALAGGAKGFADILGNREEKGGELEELLAGVNKQKLGTVMQQRDLDLAKNKFKTESALKRGELDLERAKLPSEIAKNLPKDLNEHLIGKNQITWTDPETGEEKTGVQILPSFVAMPEYLTSKEDLKDMRKKANELSEVKTYVDNLANISDNIIEAVNQLDDPSAFKQYMVSIFSKENPGALSRISQDIIIDGRKVNAGSYLKNQIGLLHNAYARSQGLGQLDRAAQGHMSTLINNPVDTLATPEAAIDQILAINELAENGLISGARNNGFSPDFVVQDLAKKNRSRFDKLNTKKNFQKVDELTNAIPLSIYGG